MHYLLIENDINNLNRVSDFVESTGSQLGLSKKDIFDVSLILDELVTNLISYGFKDERIHVIQISMEKTDSAIKLTIVDDGVPFNPTLLPAPDIQSNIHERQVGGLGIHIARKKSASFDYKRKNDNNILEIIKQLDSEK